ncbi:methyltransferase [bacterium F16]|nr:methyltransferase [bacterium F16]
MTKPLSETCRLCGGQASLYYRDRNRPYFSCETCSLVFTPPAFFLTAFDEKQHYDLHDNNPKDPGYRQFLGRLYGPMTARIPAHSSGLDFGSGPGPTLSLMFEEAGHTMAIYDLYYANTPAVLEQHYDFITASEVAEHLHHPDRELERLWQLLKPGGFLGIMTKRVTRQEAFATWHYINDPTHVCFFHANTFQWLADKWGATVDFPAPDVAIFEKGHSF